MPALLILRLIYIKIIKITEFHCSSPLYCFSWFEYITFAIHKVHYRLVIFFFCNHKNILHTVVDLSIDKF